MTVLYYRSYIMDFSFSWKSDKNSIGMPYCCFIHNWGVFFAEHLKYRLYYRFLIAPRMSPWRFSNMCRPYNNLVLSKFYFLIITIINFLEIGGMVLFSYLLQSSTSISPWSSFLDPCRLVGEGAFLGLTFASIILLEPSIMKKYENVFSFRHLLIASQFWCVNIFLVTAEI